MKSIKRFLAAFIAAVVFLSFPVGAVEPADAAPETTWETVPETTAETVLETTPETTAAETIPTEPEQTQSVKTQPEETLPPEPTLPARVDGEWNLYFGQLHAHTNLSDGYGSVEEAFSHAAGVENLDFFAVTDHSNSFDNADAGSILLDGSLISSEWASGKAAAAAVTCESFVGIFGYEMTWQEGRGLGHINTFGTPGWQSRNQPGFSTLKDYYQALTLVPGAVSQFNHPGPDYGEFDNFAHHSPEYDRVMALLEVGGEGGFTAYRYYTKALDAHWHVAPTNSQNNHNGAWGDANDARTVVLAKKLTEESLCEAMGQRRVYATEDGDFSLSYRLDGTIMGSFVPKQETHRVQLNLSDPTDTGTVKIDVIVDGGKAAASAELEAPSGAVTLTVPGGFRYYYLRLTQSDGDIAVTAPVWVEDNADVGIGSFGADTLVPTAEEPLNLVLQIFNGEKTDAVLSSIEVYAGEERIYVNPEPVTAAAGIGLTLAIPYTASQPGTLEFRAVVAGQIAGEGRNWEEKLVLSFLPSLLTADIVIDGNHGGADAENFHNLITLAGHAGMQAAIFREEIPEAGEILLIPPPQKEFSEGFLSEAAAFAQRGGTVILWGAAELESAVREQNRLLSSLGSTMRLRPDVALDEIHNGGAPETLYPVTFNPASPWSSGLVYEQVYCHDRGCTVDPGSGIWIVRGHTTTRSSLTGETAPVLLAAEVLPGGGSVMAAGSGFLSDDAMPIPQNRWEAPRINHTVWQNLLGVRSENLPVTAIERVRKGKPGEIFRIRGYATSGTTNKFNTFPDSLYLQDETGGIGVIRFYDMGLALGTPVELVGRLDKKNGNPVLDLIDYRILPEAHKRVVSQTLSLQEAMDYEKRGGSLVQVEAQVCAVTLTDDGRGVCRFTLTDKGGDRAVVLIEENILSGSRGTNSLASQVKIGRTVRVQGIVNLDSNGVRVLRVRNCEEVVYVPPVPRPGENPPTGDGIFLPAALPGICLLALAALWREKKKIT